MNDLFGSDDESEEDIKIDSDEVILYTEVLNMPDVGGNRGVFAVRDLPAGCLLCAEKPFTTWSPGIDFTEVDDLANVILQVVRSLPALQCTYTLHPKTVSECDEQEINEIRRLFDTYDNGDLQKLVVEANLNEEEIIRIALVLQHNGFNSGLYEKQSLFNHACAPNCIKLIPPGRHSASEIWTIREIKAGQELFVGTAVDLVIGSGLSDKTTTIPNLMGLTMQKAQTEIKVASLNLGAVIFDEGISDSSAAMVYRQNPKVNEKRKVKLGTSIDIYLQ